jgi:16S rRNA (cytosine1402-N4)-methyltransferase
MQPQHVPVLREEVVQALEVRQGGRYVDCTVGNGGHARAVLEYSEPSGRLLGLDSDPKAIALARTALSQYGERVILVHSNFSAVGFVARQHGFQMAQGILIDLGWSSSQLADPGRGFSFQVDGPLDMRYDPRQSATAADLVNKLSEEELAELIWRYGEDRRARRIARSIALHRPLHGTRELAELIERTIGRKERIHPATRTFQALRIAVNEELDVLGRTLEQLPDLLAPGGVLAVISFHSLEDRLVKQFSRREASGCICPPGMVVCTCDHQPRLILRPRKPIIPSSEEVAANPRSRSAKLRVAVRASC